VVALFFTRLSLHHAMIMLGMAFLTATLFSLAGLINGIFAKKFDDISIIPTFVLTPLTYLGGVFYSMDMLPVFWQKVSLANPILYMVSAFRYGVLGTTDVDIGTAFAVIIVLIGVLLTLSLYLMNRGIGIRT
jgi:ABC-2 type transport system permease protein